MVTAAGEDDGGAGENMPIDSGSVLLAATVSSKAADSESALEATSPASAEVRIEAGGADPAASEKGGEGGMGGEDTRASLGNPDTRGEPVDMLPLTATATTVKAGESISSVARSLDPPTPLTTAPEVELTAKQEIKSDEPVPARWDVGVSAAPSRPAVSERAGGRARNDASAETAQSGKLDDPELEQEAVVQDAVLQANRSVVEEEVPSLEVPVVSDKSTEAGSVSSSDKLVDSSKEDDRSSLPPTDRENAAAVDAPAANVESSSFEEQRRPTGRSSPPPTKDRENAAAVDAPVANVDSSSLEEQRRPTTSVPAAPSGPKSIAAAEEKSNTTAAAVPVAATGLKITPNAAATAGPVIPAALSPGAAAQPPAREAGPMTAPASSRPTPASAARSGPPSSPPLQSSKSPEMVSDAAALAAEGGSLSEEVASNRSQVPGEGVPLAGGDSQGGRVSAGSGGGGAGGGGGWGVVSPAAEFLKEWVETAVPKRKEELKRGKVEAIRWERQW